MKVLTLNLWDAPIVSKSRVERVGDFCSFLEAQESVEESYDVISLQEEFNDDTRKRIEDAAYTGGFKYCDHFESGTCLPQGARGSGVTVISRHPITESSFHRYGALSPLSSLSHSGHGGAKSKGRANSGEGRRIPTTESV